MLPFKGTFGILQNSQSFQVDRLVMVLLCYQDSVCWCVVMRNRSYKDEVERQVQDKLSQKTTENNECLSEVAILAQAFCFELC